MTQFYKESVIDSPVWIGAKSEKDQYRLKCLEILTHFNNVNIKNVYITDYILLETINFLLRKENFEEANQALFNFLQSDRVEIVFVDEVMLEDMKEIFKKYKNLSLTDCSIISLMREKNIKYLFSFDSGFDKVKGIIRKENI